jgi:trans-2,3-dihydro-3-hydroxyanthranilate isomerase
MSRGSREATQPGTVMQEIEYETVDVFTGKLFGGNQLAVIADARGLSEEVMQGIASEFNYSEVTFVCRAADPSNTARVRIFTPTSEIPFAGHPSIGTAFVLGRAGSVFGNKTHDVMRFEEDAGLVEVKLLRNGSIITGASIQAPRNLKIGSYLDAETIASCISLQPQDIATVRHKPVIASVGLPFAIAEVHSLEALGRMKPNLVAFSDACARYREPEDCFSVFAYTPCATAATRLRARMFAPLSNILEDPATGSASAALGGLLCSMDPRSDVHMQIVIEQGVEMGRPSSIEVMASKEAGSVRAVTVSGRCVRVMRGRIEL